MDKKLIDLKNKIGKLRTELDDILSNRNDIAASELVVEVSGKLDKLIIQYMKNEKLIKIEESNNSK